MSNPIKIGIVGLGRAGWAMHCSELENKKDNFQIVAACDLEPDRRQKMQERYNCKTYEKIEDLIADPEVELVDIATRSIDHFKHAEMALKAGKYVFLEKPMCTTYEQALALKELSESNGVRKLFIRHNRRYEAEFNQVKEIIASGILGKIFMIKLYRYNYNHRDDWQTLKEYCGGMSLNWGPHIVDHALQFLEYDIDSSYYDLKLTTATGDADDHLKLVFRNKKGLTVDLEITSGTAITAPEYEVYGDRGALISNSGFFRARYLDPEVPLEVRKPHRETPGSWFSSPETLTWKEENIPFKSADMTQIWISLYEAIREGKTFPITMDEAVAVIKVLDDARKSNGF
ncbi:MAG: gfo/Idh/MocA family oxidoreductase [Clostridia bacterium]|nr:gfo/Idh/MocA family oxidoreductase [Clostridia bacterium]